MQATRVARAASVAVQSGSSSMLRSFGPLGELRHQVAIRGVFVAEQFPVARTAR